MGMPLIIIGGDMQTRIGRARALAGDVLPIDQHLLTAPSSSKMNRQFSIREIRDLLAQLSLHPVGQKRLVYLEADLLSPLIQQLLLKLLEETPEYTLVVLGTTHGNWLLSTLRSRCIIMTIPIQAEPIGDTQPSDEVAQKIALLLQTTRASLATAAIQHQKHRLTSAVTSLKMLLKAQKLMRSSLPTKLVNDFLHFAIPQTKD